MHLFSPMSLKIFRKSDGKRTSLRLSGRIQYANVEELREQMKGDAERILLDLEEVTLVRE
jgi:anti-anti-sigma regulatory factor